MDLDLAEVIGPTTPVVENQNGGRQSHLPVRLDVIPRALAAMMRQEYGGHTETRRAIREICESLETHDARRIEAVLYGMLLDLGRSNAAMGVMVLGRVLWGGEQKYGQGNHMKIPFSEHLHHALVHLVSHEAGDRSEGESGHLAHATCRVALALECLLQH